MGEKKVMDKLPQLTNKQHEKDSEVFGALMAGAKARKKRLLRCLPGTETPKGMCAVGAGLRGRKKTRWSDVVTKAYQTNRYTGEIDDNSSNKQQHQLVPMIRFATIMDVSENYVCGVNDGFEGDRGASRAFFHADLESLDYLRGWHVGQAVNIESNPKSLSD